jgi:chitinase
VKVLLRIVSASSLLLALACTSPGTAVPAKAAEPFVPSLSLRPVSISLGAGATQAFQAEINYQEGVRYLRQPVGWRVVEPGGGTVTGAGLYTAPALAGTYHVEVRREDFPNLTATATVTVK